MTAGSPHNLKQDAFLERDEELELARRAGAGDAVAIERLIRSHTRFVVKIARGYRQSGVPMSDLIQEGMVGLVQAIRKFNPDHDARLSTYARWWIRASIQDHVVRSWSLVRLSTSSAQKSLFLQLRRLTSGLLEGADALSDDIAAKLADRFGTTAADVANLARRIAHRDQSLNVQSADTSESWLDRLATDEPTPEDKLAHAGERRRLAEILSAALARLPDREQLIIRKRYLQEARETFASIGRELNLSKDRVRQLEARALATLREIIEPAVPDRLI